jgi:hypothetical protein
LEDGMIRAAIIGLSLGPIAFIAAPWVAWLVSL